MGVSLDIRMTTPTLDLKITHDFSQAGITALFGASGAGKTSLLRIIAGFESRASGQVRFGNEVWQEGKKFVPAHKRGVGYVFQDTRLFDHLDVGGNLRFAARRGRNRGRIGFDAVVQALDLAR